MMRRVSHSIARELRRFRHEEDGVGTVFSIFLLVMLIIVSGVAIDGSNYWRHQQMMQQTADVAAHSGVVKIAMGGGEQDIRTSVVDYVEANLPQSGNGNLFADQGSDIELLRYDEITNTLHSDGTPNAVRVLLHRDQASGNPVQTIALRVSDLFMPSGGMQMSTWNLTIQGVAAMAKMQGCNSTDGLYAKGDVQLSSSNTFGAGYCLHGQNEVWLSQQNTFMPGSGISMPDLTSCGSKCTDASNPGTTAASFERNLIMPDIPAHIAAAYASFLGTGDPAQRDAFFDNKYLEDSALSALQDVGIKNTNSLMLGSVVTMTDAQFEKLAHVPEGLVYDVTCKSNGNPDSVRIEFGAEKNEPGKNGGKYFSPSVFSNVAIVTNCGFEFLMATDIKASALISTRVASTHTITANSGASVGDSLGGCDVDDQTIIMAMSDMNVPSDFAGSNVSFVVDGDINLSASSSSSVVNHSGVSFHTSGDIKIAANHTFDACANPPSGLVPTMHVIRHVAPMSEQLASIN